MIQNIIFANDVEYATKIYKWVFETEKCYDCDIVGVFNAVRKLDETQRMMRELTDYILLDVRTDEEFKESRIDGAILIPDYELASRAETELPNKDMLILIYCRSGRRSANTAQELIAMGYTNVYDFGGIIDWHYETVSG